MKIKTLQRSKRSVERECSGDLRRQCRNLDPKYHPMQRAREYTRAITAAKMNRMFAKPLIGNLGNGHRDGITATTTSRRALLPLGSGSADGEIKLWDLASRSCVATMTGSHTRRVTGLVFSISGQQLYSCSDDGFLHQWSVHPTTNTDTDTDDHHRVASLPSSSLSSSTTTTTTTTTTPNHGPLNSWRTSGSFKSIDYHWKEDQFATASDEAVCIWSPERSTALQTHSDLWGSDDTVNVVRYNPVERTLIAHCSADRGIGLHDTRTSTALKKTILRMRSNALEWNPMEPMIFAVANEDYNSYTFDMRKLQEPTKIYKGHTSAVLSLGWSPTGREFVTGSYDSTIRIFPTMGNDGIGLGFARDVYHTKRMQRVFTIHYTMDHTFIVSGSDDSNLRLWKAHASQRLGQLTTRETSSMQYRQALIQKYQHMPDVRNIYKTRKLPKPIRNQTKQALIQKDSQRRKQQNIVKHSKPGTVTIPSERSKTVVQQVD